MAGDNGKKITAINAGATDLVEQAKAMAKARRKSCKYRQENALKILNACNEYADKCWREHTPLTFGGFQLATGISMSTWYEMEQGDYDHLVPEWLMLNDVPLDTPDTCDLYEYTDENGQQQEILLIPYSEILQKCRTMIQAQLEQNCYTNKGNPAGSIFGLKARFGWQDTPQQVGTLHQTLVIADAQQARQALEMLK